MHTSLLTAVIHIVWLFFRERRKHGVETFTRSIFNFSQIKVMKDDSARNFGLFISFNHFFAEICGRNRTIEIC